MKHADLKEGMRIKAQGDWSDCWKAGEEFVVQRDPGDDSHGPMLYVTCHGEYGPRHELEPVDANP